MAPGANRVYCLGMQIDAKAAGLDAARLERITEHLDRNFVSAGKIAGCQTLVARHGHVAHFSSLGMADRERGVPVADALQNAQRGAARAGRTLNGFLNCALTNVALLEPGEAIDSDRMIGLIGPNVMASVYYFYDEVHERGIDPPPFLRKIWKRYCALVEETPPAFRHFRTHEFHYTHVHAGESELIDADLIRATCLVGTADELIERIRDLERQGLQELMFATGTAEKWAVAESFARQVIARM